MGRHSDKAYPWKNGDENDSVSGYSLGSLSRSCSEDSSDTPKAADPAEDLESQVFLCDAKVPKVDNNEKRQKSLLDPETNGRVSSTVNQEKDTHPSKNKNEGGKDLSASPRTSRWWEPQQDDSAPRWWESLSSRSVSSHSVRSMLSPSVATPPPPPLRSSRNMSLPGAFPVAGINHSDGYSGEEEKFEDEHEPSIESQSVRDELETVLLEATLVSEKPSLRLGDREQRSNELVFQAEPLEMKKMFTLRSICCLVCLLLLIAVVGIAAGTELGRRRYEMGPRIEEPPPRTDPDLSIDMSSTNAPATLDESSEREDADSPSYSSTPAPVMAAPPRNPSDDVTLTPASTPPSTSSHSTPEPTVTISTMNPGLVVLDVLPDKTKKSLDNPGTPQFLAYKWLIGDPHLNRYHVGQQVQRFALATLYFAANGQAWEENKNWMSYGADECEWFSDALDGLVCREDADNNGWYEILSLNQNTLNGTLPEEILLLSTLVSLQLYEHQLEGTIPTRIGKMLNLESLLLFDLALEGTLPTEIGLTRLKALHVGGNSLTGPLPGEIGNIEQLHHLFVNDNQFLDGPIPSELGKLTDLEELALQNNSFFGSIPSQVGLLTNLKWAYFAYNQLTEPIPEELASLVDLRALVLQSNFLKGSIPDLSSLDQLEYAFFGLNNLTGTIPVDVVTSWQSLKILDFGNNDLSGTLPAEIGLLENLQHMDLFNNTLSGTVPTELGKLVNAQTIMLEQNRLTGTIPTTFGRLTMLKRLWLHDNDLSGSMPAEICGLVEAGSLEEVSVDCHRVSCDCGCDCSLSMLQAHVDVGKNADDSKQESSDSMWGNFVEWVTNLFE